MNQVYCELISRDRSRGRLVSHRSQWRLLYFRPSYRKRAGLDFLPLRRLRTRSLSLSLSRAQSILDSRVECPQSSLLFALLLLPSSSALGPWSLSRAVLLLCCLFPLHPPPVRSFRWSVIRVVVRILALVDRRFLSTPQSFPLSQHAARSRLDPATLFTGVLIV